MTRNPFDVIKAEEFNHSLDELASLMYFKEGLAGPLLSSSNVFLDGSRDQANQCTYACCRFRRKQSTNKLAKQGKVEPLPNHRPFLGIYVKLAPTLFGPHEDELESGFVEAFGSFSMSMRWSA